MAELIGKLSCNSKGSIRSTGQSSPPPPASYFNSKGPIQSPSLVVRNMEKLHFNSKGPIQRHFNVFGVLSDNEFQFQRSNSEATSLVGSNRGLAISIPKVQFRVAENVPPYTSLWDFNSKGPIQSENESRRLAAIKKFQFQRSNSEALRATRSGRRSPISIPKVQFRGR